MKKVLVLSIIALAIPFFAHAVELTTTDEPPGERITQKFQLPPTTPQDIKTKTQTKAPEAADKPALLQTAPEGPPPLPLKQDNILERTEIVKSFSLIVLVVFVVYLLAALLFRYFRSNRNARRKEWIPRRYFNECPGAIPTKQTLIDKGEEIPSDTATLFIMGTLRSQSRTIKLFDYPANLLTFGWLRFNEIFPEGASLDLVLCFKNVSAGNFSVEGGQNSFIIIYPGQNKPSRKWSITIPTLRSTGDSYIEYSKAFFTPEMPGTHDFLIQGIPGLRYAAPHGVGGRKYKITSPGGAWRLPFYVSSSFEYKVFIVAFAALAISILSLVTTILGKI